MAERKIGRRELLLGLGTVVALKAVGLRPASADGGVWVQTPFGFSFIPEAPTKIPDPKSSETSVATRPNWSRDELLVPVRRVVTDTPMVALTLDDGWARRDQILDTLVNQKVGATLFVLGVVAEKNPDFIKRAYTSEKIELGDHTYTHKALAAWDNETDAYEIDMAEYVLAKIIGKPVTMPYLRPPYGSRNDRSIRLAAERGYRNIIWNIAGDTDRSWSADQLISLYLGQLDSQKNPWGSIMVMHFSPRVADALPQIIDGIRVRGMEPVSLSTLFANSSGVVS